MRQMKDSGIEWIGIIPASWSVLRNKTCFECSKEIVGELSSETQLLSLTTKGIKKKKAEESTGKIPESYDTYQMVSPDDIVMCLFDLDVSAVFSGRSQFYGMISPAYKVLKCNHDMIAPSYAEYWFSYVFDERKFKHYSKNLRYTLNYDEFACLPILLPTEYEQEKIASYLDRQCTLVDNIIEKTRASIEEYKKLKQAIITQAVTKGVRGDRPMKDSEVAWIGKIPREWKLMKAKYCIKVSNGSDPVTDGDIPVYGSGSKSFKTCGEYKDPPCVLIGRKGATLHIPHFVDHPYWNVDTAFDVKVKSGLVLKYYYYLACVFDYKFYISQTTLPGMTQTNYENMVLPVPVYSEQEEIVSHLENKLLKLDSLIKQKEEFLSKLESYKKSMIYEYVTGKKEVV